MDHTRFRRSIAHGLDEPRPSNPNHEPAPITMPSILHHTHTTTQTMAGASATASGASEATTTTPLLPAAADRAAGKPTSPPPPWTHDMWRQLHLQLLLSVLALLLTLLLVLAAALVAPGLSGWAIASLALGGTGMLLDAAGLVALLQQGRRLQQQQGQTPPSASDDNDGGSSSGPSLLPLTLQLLFNAGALTPYRIVATVLAFTAPASSSADEEATTTLAVDAALTGGVALVALSQLLVSVYFFRCLREYPPRMAWSSSQRADEKAMFLTLLLTINTTPGFNRAFQEAVRRLRQQQQGKGAGDGARLPNEALVALFQALGQRPTATEVISVRDCDALWSSRDRCTLNIDHDRNSWPSLPPGTAPAAAAAAGAAAGGSGPGPSILWTFAGCRRIMTGWWARASGGGCGGGRGGEVWRRGCWRRRALGMQQWRGQQQEQLRGRGLCRPGVVGALRLRGQVCSVIIVGRMSWIWNRTDVQLASYKRSKKRTPK